jgi:hypothetical protein
MEIISFGVFKEKIKSGLKHKTMRNKESKKFQRIYKKFKNSKDPLYIQIFWKQRTSQSELLGYAKIMNIRLIALGALDEQEYLEDGFGSKREGLEWFAKTHKIPLNEIHSFEMFVVDFELVKIVPVPEYLRNKDFHQAFTKEYFRNESFRNNFKKYIVNNFDEEISNLVLNHWKDLENIHGAIKKIISEVQIS